MESLNLNNLSVDDRGRVTFSGLGSGVDAVGTVDAIIGARRIPVDTLETRISDNELKITALNQLKTALVGVRDSLTNLFGSVSFGGSKDIFSAKVGFTVSSRQDGATAMAVANLVGVTTTNAAATSSHDIEILRTARAHKISSAAQASTTTALGFSNNDAFTIDDGTGTPRTIIVNSGTTLGDLRDAINSANSGTTATGVGASIVSVSTTEHYLILTKDDTGAAMTLADTVGTALETVGILTGGGAIDNELQAAQTVRMYVDGVLDQTNTIYESNFQSASTVLVGSAGTLRFTRDSDLVDYPDVPYLASDTLATLATKITASDPDITATVVTDGAGVRLEISTASGVTISEQGGGTAIADLGINNMRKAVERTSNTINDLFTGVTLNLFQAEAGTNIRIDIDQDLNKIKNELFAFVDSYNVFKEFMNGQRQTRADNAEDTDMTGVLIRSSVLEQVENSIGSILNAAVAGLTGDVFRTLPQLDLETTITSGISIVSDGADPLLNGTLQINEAKLDEALLNKIGEFERLLTFSFTSGDSRVSLLGFNGNTTYSATGYALNIQPSSGNNMFAYSEQLDNAYWNPIRASINTDGEVAPDGTTTADGLVGTAVASTHLINNLAGVAMTAGETYVFSIYAKEPAGGNNSARLYIAGAAFGSNITADFNLATGAIIGTGFGAENASIEDVGNGWYRISVEATATSSANGTFEMYSRTDASTNYTGDGSTVDTWFWGTHLDSKSTANTVNDETGLTGAPRASISANVGVPLAPDGTATADGLIASIDNNTHIVQNTAAISVTSGQQYEYSTYLQAGARDWVRLRFDSSSPVTFGATTYADVNLLTGAVVATGGTADSITVENVGAGWYKVTLAATATDSGTAQFQTLAMDSGTGIGFAGDGVTVDTYFWDQRVVPVATPTTYVPTTTAAVTGAVASANIGGDSTGFDDGSATVSGNSIVVTSGGAKGMTLYFDGFSGFSTTVQLDFTVGVGALLFYEIDQILLDTTINDSNGNPVKQLGVLAAEIDTLTDQNEISRDRVDDMLERLEIQRQSLLERFIRMETTMASAKRIMESLSQTMDALLGNN